jgi:hypothetical protein
MKLHPIGKKIAGLRSDDLRGREPYKLAGSSKLPAYVVAKPAAKVKITRAPTPPDRFAPDADYIPHFDAYLPGVNPETGKPW